MSRGECRCQEQPAEHGGRCDRMTTGCCGVCVDEDWTPQPHVWSGLPGPESTRVECMRCGYLVNGPLPSGARLCDRGRYLNHVYALHRGDPVRRCAACGGCWDCATGRFSLPLPGVCGGSYECHPEPQCTDCGEALASEQYACCEACLAGHYRQYLEALTAIERAGSHAPRRSTRAA